MKRNNMELLEKIKLVAGKLMNLACLEYDTGGLTKEEQFSKGFIQRDFGIREWDWPQGVGLYGLQKLNAYYGDGRYDDFFLDWYKGHLKKGLPSKNVNTTAPFLPLVGLCDTFRDPVYENICLDHADWLMNGLPRTKEGGFQHVTSALGDTSGVTLNKDEIWIDTLFMAVLFLNKMGQKYHRQEWIDESVHQLLLHIKYLWDKRSGLIHHGWSFRENGNFGGVFWCRGNSWFTLGIPEYLDASHDTLNRGLTTYFINTWRAQVDALISLQTPSGLFRTVLTEPDSYEEVSGSAGIAAGILKGIKSGLLDESYDIYARRAVSAICDNVGPDGTVGNVSAGTGIGRDAKHYKDIVIAPMAYGQSLALTALCEALE